MVVSNDVEEEKPDGEGTPPGFSQSSSRDEKELVNAA